MRALKIAATGMDAQQQRVEVISNNIANMSTNGYKARRAEFADLHYQQAETPGSITSNTGTVLATGVQLGLGVRLSSVNIEVSQGPMTQTGGSLDVAVEGDGWLVVELPDNRAAFTRDGSFKLSPDGLIVTTEGFQVGDGITIPPDAEQVEINGDGEVYGFFNGEIEGRLLGNLQLAMFANDKGLEAIGSNLFVATAGSGDAQLDDAGVDGRGVLRQGYLEGSTVDVVAEITELIEAQRGYEMNSKVVTAADQMLAATTQIR